MHLNLYKDKRDNLEDLEGYLEQKGLLAEEIDEQEIEQKIKKIVEENKGAPFGALMGHAMKEFAGKVDGKKISQMLKKLM